MDPDHNESAPVITDTGKMLLSRIENILSNHGQWSQCRGCMQPVYWLMSNAGKRIAYQPDGTVHFDSCTEQKAFSKQPTSGRL
jgi:hypothetical protein